MSFDTADEQRRSQAERLTAAAIAADAERAKALADEPWSSELCSTVPSWTADGELSGMISLPTDAALEVWGARVAMDLVACDGDDDTIDATIAEHLELVSNNPTHAALVFAAALRSMANVVIPSLLNIAESQGHGDVRARLAVARVRAWQGRVGDRPEGNEPR